MRNIIIKKIFFIIFFFLINYSVLFSESDGINLNLNVAGHCAVDNICGVGEDMYNCPQDCSPVITSPSTGGSSFGGIVVDNNFYNLTVEVSYNTATIKWKSVVPTTSDLKWGTNPDYRDGTVRNINYVLDHKVELTNLKEGTLYYFNIETETLLKKKNSVENQVFRTLSLLDTTPPGNPTNVEAFSSVNGITLSWVNPKDEDFDYIRIMKNLDRYHSSPSSGYLVYEGNGNYFTDSRDLKEGQKYFYSLFSRDRAGNYSSGSLISIIYNPYNKDNWGSELISDDKIKAIANTIYIVSQNSMNHDFKMGSNIYLEGDSPIDIKTNYSSRIKNDDMWVEVRDSNRMIISQYFFYRLKDKDGFTKVTIPSFEKGGLYNITIHRYYYNTSELVHKGTFQINKVNTSLDKNYSHNYYWYIIIIGILLLLIFLLYILIFILLPKVFKNKR